MNASAPSPRTLHVIGGKDLGGAERFYVRLVNALARRGHPVAAVTVNGGEIARALDSAVPQYHAPMAGVWDIYSRWKIRAAIREFGADVVQTYMGRASRIVRLPRARPPVHVARLGGFYNLRGYRHAHAWVGNTAGIRDYLLAGGLPRERVFHIGNFVDVPDACSSEALAQLRATWGLEGCIVVLGLGRLHPNKGWADLLDAFARLPPHLDGAPLHLLMVGDGPLRAHLEQRARALGLEARVHWTGWQHDPAPYYQLCDVFVCASVHEPLGNVILEAWANRTLLVSTRAEGPLELMQDGVNGLLAPLMDPSGLAEVLLHALQLDREKRRQLVESGYNEVLQHHSEVAVVSAYLDLYRTLQATPDARHN